MNSTGTIKGVIKYSLFGENGELKQEGFAKNVITVQGNAYYVDQLSDAGGSAAALLVLGTGSDNVATTDVWVSGPFSGNGTTGSAGTAGAVAITTNSGTANALHYMGTFSAGYATQNGITRVGLVNRNPESDGNGTTNGTTTFFISHGTISPTVNKGASDTLVVVWDHIFTGS